MDSGDVGVILNLLGFSILFISIIIGGLNLKTGVEKGTILNSTSGKYVEGYEEVSYIIEPISTIFIYMIIIGIIMLIIGTVVIIKFG